MDTLPQALLDRWIFVLVRVGEEFVLPFTEAGRERIDREGGYGDAFTPVLARIMTALQEPQWAPGSYYPGGWFRSLQAQGQDPLEVPIEPENLRTFHLEEVRVDVAGRWFVGPKQVTGRVKQHFLKHLEFDAALERYRINYKLETYYETRYIHPLAPPYRVVAVSPDLATLTLNDGSTEPLRMDSLRMTPDERLYVAVKPAGLAALFEDNARWQVLQHLDDSNGRWSLSHHGRRTPLQLDAPRPYRGDVLPGDEQASEA